MHPITKTVSLNLHHQGNMHLITKIFQSKFGSSGQYDEITSFSFSQLNQKLCLNYIIRKAKNSNFHHQFSKKLVVPCILKFYELSIVHTFQILKSLNFQSCIPSIFLDFSPRTFQYYTPRMDKIFSIIPWFISTS